MATSPFDSALYRDLFHDTEAGKLFTDSAAVRAMLIVEGTLAKVQGELGMIPKDSAFFIHRAAMEVQLDPAGLSMETGRDAVCVPALVNAFRTAMEAPEHAQFIHWGAASQDIIDTALILRLRQLITLFDARLGDIAAQLGALAQAHARTPMLGRICGQADALTSFGAVAANWGWPLVRARLRLATLKPALLSVSLSGTSGTLGAMGPQGPEIRSALATALRLGDPGGNWHSTREQLVEFSSWMTLTAGALGKMGEYLLLLMRSNGGEVQLGAPKTPDADAQKVNPVGPSVLVALARQITALNGAMQGAMLHREQRDDAAWMVEWMSLPQICMGLAKGLAIGQDLAATLVPQPGLMARTISASGGAAYAESLGVALSAHMPRPKAQEDVKSLCAKARESGQPLAILAAERWPDLDLSGVFDAARALGDAPVQAETFAQTAKAPFNL